MPPAGANAAAAASPTSDVKDAQDFDPADLIVKKKRGGIFRLLSPVYNKVIQPFVNKMRKKQMLNEKRMLRKEEQMKQDVERILMEIEEQHSWVALGELRSRNLVRLKKEELIDAAKRKELRKVKDEHEITNTEQGLFYKLGNIDRFTKWQNSSSKFQDIAGHKGTVFSVKLSKCLKYVISTSEDGTACLWLIEPGKTKYPKLIYEGHTKKVIDADFHPDFEIDSPKCCIATASGDGTLKFWNTMRERAVRSVDAHLEAVYRCRFSPDGTRVLSCSEDKSLKVWAFPEGYCLHVYRGHTSGVTSCAFSPSGRWIVSGSDYGERKLLLWDAQAPHFEKPTQYPHQIFWTPDGLIKKILIRQRKPTPYFWFTTDQLQLLGEKAKVESWTGQYDEIDMPDESDGEEEEGDTIVVDLFGKDDARELKGASLQVLYTDKDGKTVPATEYMPGGKLTFCVECADVQISEAFLSVTALDTAYDAFVEDSGKRLGVFIVTYPLPWEMERAKIDVLGIRKPERIGDDLPEGLTQVDNDQALVYHNKDPIEDEDGNVIQEFQSKFGVVWFCPGPNMGAARVQLTFRFQKSETWCTLNYSLKESPIRVASALDAKGTDEPEVQYTFDQEARHLAFFNHIRDKNWEAVQSFIDKKAVMFKDKVLKKRRWRIMDTLEDIFMDAESIVLPSPVIFKAGQTRSTLLMEFQPYFYNKRPRDDSDSEVDNDAPEQDLPQDEDEQDAEDVVEKSDADDIAVQVDDKKMGVEAAPTKESEVEEDKDDDEEETRSDTASSRHSGSPDKNLVPELALPISGTDVSAKYKVDDEDSDEDAPLSPVYEDPADTVLSNAGGFNGIAHLDQGPGAMGTQQRSNPEGTPEPVDTITTGAGTTTSNIITGSALNIASARDDLRLAQPTTPKAKDLENSAASVKLDDQGKLSEVHVAGEEESLGSLDSSNVSIDKVESIGPEDDEDIFVVRPKTRKQHIREFIFAGETEGKKFAHEVEHRTDQELFSITFNRMSGVHKWKEIMQYAVDPQIQEELLAVPGCPRWVQKVEFKRIHEYHTRMDRKGYYDLLKHPYVKSTLFGPDILKFSMPLPEIFPRRAGRSVNAFTMQLLQYEAARRREDANKIPLTAAEVDEENEGGEFSKSKTIEEKRKELADTLRPQIALNLLSSRAYLATRRNCLPSLPGMQDHYPNPDYLEPCEEHPFMPLPRPKESFLTAMLKAITSQNSRVVSPVGRRPNYPDFYGDVEGHLRAKAEAAREESRRLFGRKRENEEDTQGGEGDNPHFPGKAEAANNQEPIKAQEGAISPPGSAPSSRQSQPSQRVNTPIDAGKEGHVTLEMDTNGIHASESGKNIHDNHQIDSSKLHEEDGVDEHGAKKHKHHHKHHHHHHHKVEIKEEVVSVEPEPEVIDPAILAAQRRAEADELERKRRLTLGIPTDVWLGRRGSFMVAPGLEPFEDGAKAKPQHVHVHSQGGKHEDVQKAEDQETAGKSYGLLRKCINFLGNEIVHHGSINDVAFAPSENRMATAGGDKLVKIWDPRDGTLVRVLSGHTGEVTALRYSHDELYLVSVDADAIIIIWDLTSNLVFKRLYGHADAITSLDMSPDCTMLVTASYDRIVKTWYLTPRIPGQMDPPRVIAHTDKTVILVWTSPPAFNLDITAFHIQWRVEKDNHWEPLEGQDEPYSVNPTARSKTIKNLIAGTPYQFRIRAINLMGIGPYSVPSKLVRTDLGIPDKVELPKICGVTINSMRMYFFTPNPESFGGASQRFEVRYSGNGIEMEQSPIKPFTLEEAVREGKHVLAYFKNKLTIKPLKILQRKEKLLEEPEEDMGFQIANEFMAGILRKVEEDPTHLFVSVQVENLEPGFQYRFQVRGVNDEDAGPWSDGTYSYATHPTLPRTPVPPFIEERTLTSIKFAWHAPDGRGTAIVGYVLQVQHTGKEFKLPRSQQWFELIHLLPGNSYYVRVKALNEVGPSEYSDWNSLENSHTLTAKPEKATRPVAISGTWNSIDIETRLPYNNGSPITEVSVQHRWVEAFNKGEWETPLHLSVDERKLDPLITVVEHVESDAYVKMLLEEEKREAEERKKGYNPFKEKKAQLSLSEKLNQVKPEGSKLRIHMSDLNSNTLYEFRVSYKNYMGSGMISEPSHRAKTNAALPPEPPTEFSIIESILVEAEGSDVNSNSALVNFGASFDRQGGAYIVQYVIQCRNITVDKQELEAGTDKANSAAVHYAVFKRSPSNASLENLHFTVKDLMCGHSYQFRIRADNEGRDQGIPDGVYSEWTEELVMPKPVEKEDESEVQSVSTKKESVYVEEADANEDDSDLDIDIDILNQPLPTSRGGEAMSKSKGKTSDALKGKNTTGRSILAANLEPGSYQK